jgi:hypothetical protein
MEHVKQGSLDSMRSFTSINYVISNKFDIDTAKTVSSRKWIAGNKEFENRIIRVSGKKASRHVIIVGRSTENPNWKIVLNLLEQAVINIDKQNSQLMYRKSERKFNVSNGFQKISNVDKDTPIELLDYVMEILI